MSASPTPSGEGFKAKLQELKTDKKTQGALAGFACALAFMVWMFWPDAPKKRAQPTQGKVLTQTSTLDNRQRGALERFASLAELGKSAELPGDARMYRDLFLFDLPAPAPEPVKPPPVVKYEPPTPPTEAELKARQLQADKDRELSYKPKDLRYIGFMERASVGRVGAFMKGDEPAPVKLNEVLASRWKLVTLTDTYAEFQNLKYADLRYRLDAVDASSSATKGQVTNEF